MNRATGRSRREPAEGITETERNIWCPDYDACLSKAALRDQPLDCAECPLKHAKMTTFVLTLAEIHGCRALVRAIFSPKI